MDEGVEKGEEEERRYSCGSYDCQGCECKQQHGDGQVKLTTVHEQKEKENGRNAKY